MNQRIFKSFNQGITKSGNLPIKEGMGQVHGGKGETAQDDTKFGPCQGRGFKDQKNPRAGQVHIESAPQWHFRVWFNQNMRVREVDGTYGDIDQLMESLSYDGGYRRGPNDIH